MFLRRDRVVQIDRLRSSKTSYEYNCHRSGAWVVQQGIIASDRKSLMVNPSIGALSGGGAESGTAG